jgi:hypothetical protein
MVVKPAPVPSFPEVSEFQLLFKFLVLALDAPANLAVPTSLCRLSEAGRFESQSPIHCGTVRRAVVHCAASAEHADKQFEEKLGLPLLFERTSTHKEKAGFDGQNFKFLKGRNAMKSA